MALVKILKEIDALIAPTKETSCLTVEEVFFKKLNEVSSFQEFDELKCLEQSLPLSCPFKNEQWWIYLKILMEKFLLLKIAFTDADEKESLISLNQLQTIKSSLQILVSMGLVTHLSPGIGIRLDLRSSVNKELLPKSNSEQKTFCLNLVLRCVMCLKEEETLRNLLASAHTGDFLAAIFHLLLDTEFIKSNQSCKGYLEKQLSSIIEETTQPLLIKELLLLYGNKECPAKLSRALRLILVERLVKENGVVATCRAILDVAGDLNSPQHWETLSLIAKLISTPHKKQITEYRDKVFPQILKLLSTSEVQFSQIAVICVRTTFEKEPQVCHQYFIDKICKPFSEPSEECDVDLCIDSIYNSLVQSPKHWALPPHLFKKVYIPIFRLYCFVSKSASHLKNKLKKIVLVILSEDMDYNGFVFGLVNLKFNFGEHGGICTQTINGSEEEQTPWGDATDTLLDLIEGSDKIKVKLFKVVLSSLDCALEKKIVGVRVLSELSTNPEVLKWIEEEPVHIVNFVKTVLELNYDNEITCIGMMVLSIILNCEPRKNNREWNVYDTLIEPLKKLKTTSDNVELRVLADELYSIILTKGVIRKEPKEQQPLMKIKDNNYAQAMIDVTDPLLPIRAHALRALGKLILIRDPDASQNKDKIFCLFKENLKCDDSYVYLSAIEGLATLASTFPDEVLVTLSEQLVHCKIAETRLKIGEIFMRVIRILGDMAVVYKNEIINAVLFGCRDDDHLVRASSLSSLGELCRILSFKINIFLAEIFECIKRIVETEKFVEPKRAAVMLLTLLLKGLESDALTILEPILLEMYRLLKFIYSFDKDDITKLHAQLAIEELNSKTVTFFLSPRKLEKHIFVLHPPR